MATTKKTKKNKAADPKKLNADIEEKIEVKKLLKDERSHKIAGTFLMLIAFLLIVSFTSYLFTWKQDYSKVVKGSKILFSGHNESMENLLGTAGAYFSHLFFRYGFGIASYLICTFFFVAGVNLFSPKKIFSVSRNIRYIIVGLLVISVTASFIMSGDPFPWGGAVGDMESQWLQQVIGKVGTAALLIVAVLCYIIWRFNPSFNFKNKKTLPGTITAEENDEIFSSAEFAKAGPMRASAGNFVPLMSVPQKEENGVNYDLQIIEKPVEPAVETTVKQMYPAEEEKIKNPVANDPPGNGLTLEVKSTPSVIEKEKDVALKSRPHQPYDPILDLRNYKFPTIDLLETHGSEKIIQDVTELETNKNQIINTLKNYDIEIQKIYATVGPTVTLYEIVPAPGVRISRIKNLEDDIALSLAALGIRIIAPIPGKGTIGIEVPNVKKDGCEHEDLIKFREISK